MLPKHIAKTMAATIAVAIALSISGNGGVLPTSVGREDACG
jgi:hypothetical protein